MATAKPKSQLSIQYLRAAAALMVVAFHAFFEASQFGYGGHGQDVLTSGVDVFFVISGFIMWYTTFPAAMTPLAFFRRRITRIVPLYWTLTSVVVAVLLIHPGYVRSMRFQLHHVIASYLFIPAVHPLFPNRMEPVLTPGWTLNYEMFFYLLFGVCLTVPRRWRHFAVVGAITAVASLSVFRFPYPSLPGFYCSSIILEFAGGVILGYLLTRGVSLPSGNAILLFAAGVLGLAAMSFFRDSGLPRALIWGVPAMAIVSGAVFYEQVGGLPDLSVPRLLGDASYSIYLSHPILLSAFSQFWREAGLADLPGAVPIFIALCIVLAAAGGVAVYYCIELPLSQVIGRKRMLPSVLEKSASGA